MSEISPKAIVEPGAELADDVRVGPFSYVGPHVRIGAGCVIENNVSLTGHTTLGERNHVFPMAAIGASLDGPEDRAVCRIGDANSFREHVTVYGGAETPTRVGADNLIMIDSTVGAGAEIGNHCVIANLTHIGPAARMEDYTHTSGFAAIEPGVTVGAYTFIVAYAGIDRDVPPYATVQGAPYRIRGVNTHKLRRCGFGDDDIRALKDAFRELFNGSCQGIDPDVLARWSEQTRGNARVRRLLDALASAGGEKG